MSVALKSYIIFIKGKVQGVGFRYNAKIQAMHLNIKGIIKNESDRNSVYVEVTGDEKNLEKFISWCRNGPELARVDNVNVVEKETLTKFKSFEIMY